MNIKQIFNLILFTSLLIPVVISGKTQSSNQSLPLNLSSENIKALENRFRPLLENKVFRSKRDRGINDKLSQLIDRNSPSDIDFLMLAQAWNNLSPEFKSLYKAASQIPDSFHRYLSPSGHFEIGYALEGIDAVDTTDQYGYNANNWRNREEIKNGIPDYIDEVAWALDSSWSVQISRFGLAPPIPYSENNTSGKYLVIVENQQYGDIYGLTWVGEKSSEASKGYSSYISIRNDWPTPQWHHLGYDLHPELGIRVTCAHEFFHAVQYSMSWSVISQNGLLYLDNFPLSWIEGSATAMEEFLFNDINDYVQYANLYFSNPGMSFLNGSSNVYTNSILILYLLKKTNQGISDNFISLVHKNNYNSSTDFIQNINSASSDFHYQWPELLNSFHTASFFSGALSDTNLFLSDAPLYDHWTIQDIRNPRYGSQISINPYAMGKFYIQPEKSDIDTLWVLLQNDQTNQNSNSEKSWAASIIVKNGVEDTIIPVQLNSSGDGFSIFPNWKLSDYAVTLVTNAHPELNRRYSVYFEFSGITYHAETNHKIYSTDSSAFVNLKTGTDLRGTLQLSPINNLSDFVQPSSSVQIGSAYNISIPDSWKIKKYKNNLTISFSVKIQTVGSRDFIRDSIFIYKYNDAKSIWEKRSTAHSFFSSDSAVLSLESPESGKYAVFTPNNISNKIVVYPNRIHLQKKSQDSIYIAGANINEIRLHSIDGDVICKERPAQDGSLNLTSKQSLKYRWHYPKELLSPGFYTMAIVYRNNSGEKKTVLRKLIVAP